MRGLTPQGKLDPPIEHGVLDVHTPFPHQFLFHPHALLAPT